MFQKTFQLVLNIANTKSSHGRGFEINFALKRLWQKIEKRGTHKTS